MIKRPGYVHRSIGLALLAGVASMGIGQAVENMFSPAPDRSFYQSAQDHADEECAHVASVPASYDVCWRATLADFYIGT